MTERERLIELLNVHQDYGTKHIYGEWEQGISSMSNELIADYLLENGVIVPPCKVGQTVYVEVLNRIEGFVITNFEFSVTTNGLSCGATASNGVYPLFFGFENVGRSVFLTKEEAEQALRKEDESNG